MSKIIHVAVAVIVNENNEVCISLRHKYSHQGGLWEFPGGKVENDETVEQALVREIKEEIGIEIREFRPLINISHNYQDSKQHKAVCLQVYKVLSYRGKALGHEGQQVKWQPVNQLSSDEFPAANLSIIKAVQLPEKYLITGKFIDSDDFINKLKNALNNEITLVQLRLKNNSLRDLNQLQPLVEQTAVLCKQAGAKLMLNLSNDSLDQIDLSKIEFSGFHADSKTLQALSQRPDASLFSASCHNKKELLKAERLNADFLVLSPVQKTASHPEMQAMGWSQFSNLVENIPVPVYALGGVSEIDLETAWQHGAQGIAAISALWV